MFFPNFSLPQVLNIGLNRTGSLTQTPMSSTQGGLLVWQLSAHIPLGNKPDLWLPMFPCVTVVHSSSKHGFLLFFCDCAAGLGFELRVSGLEGTFSTTLATPVLLPLSKHFRTNSKPFRGTGQGCGGGSRPLTACGLACPPVTLCYLPFLQRATVLRTLFRSVFDPFSPSPVSSPDLLSPPQLLGFK
jgi:hypothetical protein